MSALSLCWRAVFLGLVTASCAAAAQLDYAGRLGLADDALRVAERSFADQPGTADAALDVVETALDRAWLSGAYSDFARAEAALAAATVARGGSPRLCLTAARLHLTLHRVSEAERALAGCTRWSDSRLRGRLEADIAYARGDLGQAAEDYRQLLNAQPDVTGLVSVATVHEAMGQPEEAKALYAEAERRDLSNDPARRAWLKLRRAHVALHQGRWEEARAIYLAAAEALPGWWLIEEHLAEVEEMLGQLQSARQRYAAIIDRTGMPEFMDALAELEAENGEIGRAKQLRTAARSAYEQRLKRFPEAAAGHALDHFLAQPEDAHRALELAEANYANRPFADSAISLAHARWQAGNRRGACTVIETSRQRGWQSAEILWLAAECADDNKFPPGKALRDRAQSLNSRAAQMYGFARSA